MQHYFVFFYSKILKHKTEDLTTAYLKRVDSNYDFMCWESGFDNVNCVETAPTLVVSINVFVAGPGGNYQRSEKYVIQRGGIGYNNRMAYI